MRQLLKIYTITFLVIIVASCSNLAQKNPDNKPVRLIHKYEVNVLTAGEAPDCRYLGEVIGSEGHWYTYLFISNRKLIQGAINDLHNSANAIGANVVYISDNIDFTTSVTFYGQAYDCKYDEIK
ncbi:MAG: DUF4156 domain-containing protein [Gammaproteobacteria bacterium]|nr:DUF4156 domain-containing protein [Gammaproteobacteria bacterium]